MAFNLHGLAVYIVFTVWHDNAYTREQEGDEADSSKELVEYE